MTINNIRDDGFVVKEVYENYQDIALISLRLSLKAFFSTYKHMSGGLFSLDKQKYTRDEIDKKHTIYYVEAACEAIVHFQHFVELVIKQILRSKHQLLAMDASKNHLIFNDLLENSEVDENRLSGIKSLEFSEALERLIKLLDKGKFQNNDYDFFINEKAWLKELNGLRNRITHRGSFILRYESLDNLFGRYALPLMKKILDLHLFQKQYVWSYRPLYAAFDPIDEIINTFHGSYHIDKIALLKEFARAAYENPIWFGRRNSQPFFSDWDIDRIKQSEILAKHVQQSEFIKDIKKCPVCGVDSLILFNDSVDIEGDDGEPIRVSEFVYMVKCYCCSLEINNDILNIADMGLPVEHFWEGSKY